MSDIDHNFRMVREQIKKSERVAGRVDGSVSLVAVSKTQSREKLLEALAAGQRLFGENKVQEAQEHWQDLRREYPDLRLHLIGPLQTNKARDAVSLFDCIETLDREKLAVAIQLEIEKQRKNIPCYIQVNTGEEEQKGGIAPQDLKDFYAFATQDCALQVTGLMCIPPVGEPAGLHFVLLRKYAGELGLPNLSMGMSADYKKAIQAGATHVRIGTALFGSRIMRA